MQVVIFGSDDFNPNSYVELQKKVNAYLQENIRNRMEITWLQTSLVESGSRKDSIYSRLILKAVITNHGSNQESRP